MGQFAHQISDYPQMTPDEKVDQEIWAVLKDIKEQSRFPQYHVEGKPVAKCRLPEFSSAGIIALHRIEDILKFLEKEGAYKIQTASSGGRLTNKSKDAFYLIIDPKKFEKIFDRYRIKVAPDHVNVSAEEFLSTISDEAKNKLWKTVNALRLAYELEGDVSFHLPWEKFKRNRASEEDTIANLRNLHRREFITVTRDILSRDPEKLPYWAKPRVKGAETIVDNKNIYNKPDTIVTLRQSFFVLQEKLRDMVHSVEPPADTNKDSEGKENEIYTVDLVNEKVVINNRYTIARVQLHRPNDSFIHQLLEETANKNEVEISKAELEEKIEIVKLGNLTSIVTNLGFVKELRKVFFPRVGQSSVVFRTRVPKQRLIDEGVNLELLTKQLDLQHSEKTLERNAPIRTG